LNAVIGYVLFKVGRVSTDDNLSMVIFLVGAAAMSLMLAKNFVNKDKI
jgi:hypothetical protein